MLKIIKLQPNRYKEAKKIRLNALRTDPESFSSRLEDTILLPDKEWKERLNKSLINEGSFTYYAEDEEEIVGMAGAMLLNDKAEIFGVFVSPEYRGQKIGTKLIEQIFDTLINDLEIFKVFLYVNITQLPAVNLYNKLGFKIVSTEKDNFKKNNKSFDTYLMEIKIR